MQASRSDESVASGRIGARLEELRQQLLSCGHVLAGLAEPSQRSLVTDALAHLGQLECRVAVVGQIKSGKSSAINALARSPHLLPTRITPWTTAVTNLHFAQTPPGGYGAVFSFFEHAEWDQLAEGGGRVRELTEQLVPGFAPEHLLEQAALLRQRASERLGPEFELLLGQAHFFEALAPGMMEDYVCAGDFTGPQRIGKYSDITKSADVYLDQGPFAFPSTVVDTPGTNDPFLIRDEITRRSLESADVYVVVLTACQPLSETDVSLLRIMRGLYKDRIVVLVNRIDDLADLDVELPKIAGYVEQRLLAEFPGSHIPVVYGSAWWANQAYVFEPDAAARILTRRSAGYLLRAGLLQPNELHAGSLASGDFCDRVRQSLLAMSGIPALGQAIETLMAAARPTYVQRKIAHSFAEMARACESAARSELQILLAAEASSLDAKSSAEDTFSIYTREHDLLAGVAADIEQSAAGIEAQLARIIQEEQDALRGMLQSSIALHAARERDVLVDTLSRGRCPRVWTHEGVALRRALARVFKEGFEKAAWRLTSFHARVVPELHKLMRTLVPQPDLEATHSGEALVIPTPAVTPISRLLVLDLKTAGWSALWSRHPSAESSGEKIEALIRAEFAPIAEELVQLAGRVFHDFSTTTIQWSLAACRNIQLALTRRLELVLAEHDAARRSAAPSGAPPPAEDFTERIRAQAQRLEDTEALTQHVEYLARYFDTILKIEASEPNG
ncbi:dynamin family protein [Hyphomicrobium nitrativorans]|uniref:dynamin family protein n=1 Tax=Hyphomicrobium nitrativorans TaxID=1427356 RepID=UPI0009DE5045|nr:dynamin family protein [Hyphomicrobium nitrativorans]